MRAGHQKDRLRGEIRSRRDRLSGGEIARLSGPVVRRVMQLRAWERSTTRLLFCSFGSEVRTDALIGDTLANGARLVLPRVRGMEEPLALHEVRNPEEDLAPESFGILEPDAGRCPELSIDEIDFVLVPGLAFDRSGGRLGYGGGFFDYILNLRGDLLEQGAAIAVAFSLQIVDGVPLEGWDVRVPLIATENELIDVREERAHR